MSLLCIFYCILLFPLTYLLTLACSPIELAWLPGSVSFCPIRGLTQLRLDVSGDSGLMKRVVFCFDFIGK